MHHHFVHLRIVLVVIILVVIVGAYHRVVLDAPWLFIVHILGQRGARHIEVLLAWRGGRCFCDGDWKSSACLVILTGRHHSDGEALVIDWNRAKALGTRKSVASLRAWLVQVWLDKGLVKRLSMHAFHLVDLFGRDARNLRRFNGLIHLSQILVRQFLGCLSKMTD